MKKYGKFFKKAALTAAVCLSLSQSVWAMPTGGEVEFGNVTGFSANPTSGATIATVSDAAIINWEAFGIASGEALSFDTTNGALLNRVTGGNLSQILGTLSQTGDNPMFLVNPAGITVGGGAVIDANTLVLSTLAMSNEQFMHAANGWMEFGDGSTPGQLTIEKGAEINVSNMLTALGGTVEVADGVTFSVDKDLVLTAANNVTASVGSTVQGDYTLGSDAFRPTGISATKENTLSVGTNTINTEDLAFLAGGKVNITGAEIGSKNVDVLSASSGQTTESDADIVYTAGTDNAITIKGATLKSSDDLDILGGVVTIDNSELSGSGIDIAAVGEYTAFANGDAANRPLGTGHTLSLTSTTVTDTDGSDIFMGGGAVTLNGATVTSPTKVFISAYNDDRNGTMEKGNALAVSSKSNIHADGAVTLLGYTTSISDSKLSGERLQLAAATSGTAKDNDSFFFTSMKMAPDNKITMTKATIEDTKIAYISGGNVALTDTTVTAANTENKDDLKIWALSGVTANGDDNISPDFSSASGASSDYAVTLKNSNVTLNTSGSKDPGISISGGKVTLDASTLALSGGDDNSINVYAANGQEDDTITATSENLIELKNGSMIDSQGERIELVAGQISVDDSTIKAKNAQNVFLVANDNIEFQTLEGLSTGTPYGTGTKDNIAISTDSTVPTGATIDGNQTTPEPTPEPEPTPTPEPAPTPSIPEDVQEAYSEGMGNMQAAISGASTQAARERATRSLVAGVNQGTGSDRAKAAEISGMMVAILQDSSLTDSQKISLQVEVVNNFTPTKNAKAEADNTVTNAAQAASNAPTNQSATEAATQSGAASEESPVRIG